MAESTVTRRSRRSQVAPRTVWVVGLNVLLLVGALAVIRTAWTVISWILIALFIALALDPAVRFLHRRAHLRRGLAVLAVAIGMVGLFSAMGATIVPMVSEQAKKLAESAPQLAENLQQNKAFLWVDERLHLKDSIARLGEEGAGAAAAAPAMKVISKVFEGLAATFTITSMVILMLIFGGDLYRGILSWFEPHHRRRLDRLARKAHTRVGGYVSGTLIISSIGGLTIGTVLAIMGNPYFLALGLIMVVLGIVPWVGSAVGALLAVLTTLAAQGGKQALIVLGIYLVYQQIEGEVLQPLIQRKTIRMNPLLIAIVMLIGTAITGLLGTLLALPVAGAVQVVLQDVRRRRKAKWAMRARVESGQPRQLPLWPHDERTAVH